METAEGVFERMVHEHQHRIFALGYALTGDRMDAEEVAQDTFLRAYRALITYAPDRVRDLKQRAWLHRIAVNQCITRQRRAKVRGETALEDEAEKNAAVFALPLDISPARTAEKLERSVAVRRAVGSLPVDLRQVVVMKEFEELTFQQISEALELPLSTVKSRLYTALRQLQMRLQKFGE